MRISARVGLYGAVAVSLFLCTAVDAAAATAVPQQVHASAAATLRPATGCGYTSIYNSNSSARFTTNGVNIRSGPSTSCASRGLGYESNSVTVRCDDASSGWLYLTDNSTGVTGWSSPSYVTWSGSTGNCSD